MADKEKSGKVHYLENGKWINEEDLELIHTIHFSMGGYHVYKTRKENYVKQRFGLISGQTPDFEELTKEDFEEVEKYLNPKPEDEF